MFNYYYFRHGRPCRRLLCRRGRGLYEGWNFLSAGSGALRGEEAMREKIFWMRATGGRPYGVLAACNRQNCLGTLYLLLLDKSACGGLFWPSGAGFASSAERLGRAVDSVDCYTPGLNEQRKPREKYGKDGTLAKSREKRPAPAPSYQLPPERPAKDVVPVTVPAAYCPTPCALFHVLLDGRIRS